MRLSKDQNVLMKTNRSIDANDIRLAEVAKKQALIFDFAKILPI